MVEEKKDNQSVPSKKKKGRKRFWMLVDLGILLVVIGLMLYRPGKYEPIDSAHPTEVSYWYDVLIPDIYNHTQDQKPFTLVVTESGINQAVAESGWPKTEGEMVLRSPQVSFVDERVVLMGTASYHEFDLVITASAAMYINEEGLLDIDIKSVRVGALPVTIAAKLIATKMYNQRIAGIDTPGDDIGIKLAGAIFSDKAFDPVFKIDGEKIRISGVRPEKERLIVDFEPASK